MNHKLCIALMVMLVLAVPLIGAPDTNSQAPAPVSPTPPAPMREFRGVWVASVANIDWPSKPGLSTAQQKAELLAILDRAAALHLNAVILQVRPACDALYDSKLEPWSEYLTGQQGKAPDPYYDPLAFAVDEAHRRGLELHAWFNPYRARHSSAQSPPAPTHISRTHPELVKTYGKSLWLDPGDKAVQDYSISVIMDVVHRYDIDGVHLDDYFYPYKEKNAAGKVMDFPDDDSWQRYRKSGGTLTRDNWRRQNVDTFVHRLYLSIKAEKPWVKFGISPFGIYRPGYPAQIQGFDAYAEIYCDSRKWLTHGWLDYLAPQLYWKISQKAQSYPVLLDWWASQNTHGRNLWPGLYTSRVGDRPTDWPASEIDYQVRTTRGIAGATGNIHYSMKALMDNRGGVADRLAALYAQPALVPASPWLDPTVPDQPKVTQSTVNGAPQLTWEATGKTPSWLWVVQTLVGDTWTTQILPEQQTTIDIAAPNAAACAVSAVSRCGIQSKPTVITLDAGQL